MSNNADYAFTDPSLPATATAHSYLTNCAPEITIIQDILRYFDLLLYFFVSGMYVVEWQGQEKTKLLILIGSIYVNAG